MGFPARRSVVFEEGEEEKGKLWSEQNGIVMCLPLEDFY